MADEQDLTNAVPQEEPQVEPQRPAYEERALAEGWVPEDEWTGDPDQWRPAKEFLDRGELFRKIEDQKRELKHMRAAIEDLGRHHAEVKKIAFREALATLKAEKKEALEAGDHDAVVQIDDKIAEAREAQKALEVQPRQTVREDNAAAQEVFSRWEVRNRWYRNDPAMKGAADEVARVLVERGINDPIVLLSEIDKQIRKEFPQKFENPNRAKAGAVEGSARPSSSRAKDEVVMSDQEKAIMKRIISTGVMTKEKYLEEFKARQGG